MPFNLLQAVTPAAIHPRLLADPDSIELGGLAVVSLSFETGRVGKIGHDERTQRCRRKEYSRVATSVAQPREP